MKLNSHAPIECPPGIVLLAAPYRRHWNGSVHLEKIDDNTVRGRCYLLAFNGKPKSLPAIADCGVYEDTIVRENGAWKFLKRRIEMDATTFAAPVKSSQPA